MSERSDDYCVELEEEEVKIVEGTFANEACCWVAYEVKKVLKDKVEKFGCKYPGSHFSISEPKTTDKPTSIYLTPVSDTQVSVYCLHIPNKETVLSPEEAVEYILSL